MLFQLPPSLPPAEAVSPIITVMAQAEIADTEIFSSCKKGSRDCFPEDRVGATPAAMSILIPLLQAMDQIAAG